jgi:hypothetical protein
VAGNSLVAGNSQVAGKYWVGFASLRTGPQTLPISGNRGPYVYVCGQTPASPDAPRLARDGLQNESWHDDPRLNTWTRLA